MLGQHTTFAHIMVANLTSAHTPNDSLLLTNNCSSVCALAMPETLQLPPEPPAPAPHPSPVTISALEVAPRLGRRRKAIAVRQRQSARIAAQAPAKFMDMATIAKQRKALLNSLSGCSATLKKHVTKNNILSRNKLPLGPSEIPKLVSAAGVLVL